MTGSRGEVRAAGVLDIDFTDTLPNGDDHVSWETANLDAVEQALAG